MKGRERNQPCPCGSGLKTKKCCESAEAQTARFKEARERRRIEAEERAEQRRMEREAFRKKTEGRPVSPAMLITAMSAIAAINLNQPNKR